MVVQECLRLGGFLAFIPPAAEPSSYPVFHYVWSYAVGFSLASEAYGITDVFHHLSLYLDHGMGLNDVPDWYPDSPSQHLSPGTPNPESQMPTHEEGSPSPDYSEEYSALDRELDRLIVVREREQLETLLGLAFSVSEFQDLSEICSLTSSLRNRIYLFPCCVYNDLMLYYLISVLL